MFELFNLSRRRKGIHSLNRRLSSITTNATKQIAIANSLAPSPGFCCIGITDYCFFKCKMCDKWKEDIKIKEKVFPSLAEWRRFIFELSIVVKDKLHGNWDERFELNFAGGESLTHIHTLELVKYANKLGFRTVIPSNGFMINDSMAKKLHDAGLTGLNLSLDSLNPKIHDEFRGFKGAYKGVVNAIKALEKYRYPEVGIIGIIHDKTYKGIPELVKWTINHKKLEWILIMAIMQPNNTIFQSGWYEKQKFNELWPSDINATINVIDELTIIKEKTMLSQKSGLTKRDPIINSMHQLRAFKNYFKYPEKFVKNEAPCNFDTAVQVSAVGDIHMCYHYEMLGNVKFNNFVEAWNSAHAKKVRDKIVKCKTNCHELINCYYKEDYPFEVQNQ
jgi:MoaA/NifB/PqqE/SkfB family radical SAM enzyme